jgi:hypothetical protein
MNKIKTVIVSAFVVLGLGAILVPQTAGAINVFPTCANGTVATSSEVCKAAGTDTAESLVKTLVNTLLYIVGALAVVVIIAGGIMYTVSNGDQNNITRAKNIVTYAVVGLVVSFIAYAIVNWVLNIF